MVLRHLQPIIDAIFKRSILPAMMPRKRAPVSVSSLPATLPSSRATSQSNTGSEPASAAEGQGQGQGQASSQSSQDAKDGSQPPTSDAIPSTKQVRKSRSWYDSWPRKSKASTQVARETIQGTLKSEASADFTRFESKKNMDASGDSDSQSPRPLPRISENNATAAASQPRKDIVTPMASETQSVVQGDKGQANEETPNIDTATASKDPESTGKERSPISSGWLDWIGLSSAQATPRQDGSITKPQASEDVGSKQTEPNSTPQSESTHPPPEIANTAKNTSSWLGPWFSSTATPNDPVKKSTEQQATMTPPVKEDGDVVTNDIPSRPDKPATKPSAGSTWAFWSRDTGSKNVGKSSAAQEQGELAVIGDGSESSPRRSSGVELKADSPIPVKEPPLKKGTQGTKKSKGRATAKDKERAQPQPSELDNTASKVPSRPETPTSAKARSKAEAVETTQPTPPNLLLPSFRATYHERQNASIIQQIAQLLLRTPQPPVKHAYLVKQPPRIKKAIAIGVHGLFPATYLRPMIGQPTGTSLRFANQCADAIRRWADGHGCADCEIEKVALEGEGKIAERVDNLWKLLLNWIDHLRSADLIVVACHSQGVPVGLMLVAKLIDLGIITTARIGVCAMAGVSLGPFPDYKSGMGMLMGAAAELWQFADPESELSKRYEHALEVALQHGTRITYVGSIDDQLVPMESAIYSPASHPYIYRAVFIDGRIHAPDFIAHLVGFALKLRNLGISDQGLIRELSVALAGSLYSGEGHSRLYDDGQVYDLAISHALETTTEGDVPLRVDKYQGLASPNPYILPWIMRGLLEEDFVKSELSQETRDLLQQFDDWKPVTKALRDIKFRLDAVRSKL